MSGSGCSLTIDLLKPRARSLKDFATSFRAFFSDAFQPDPAAVEKFLKDSPGQIPDPLQNHGQIEMGVRELRVSPQRLLVKEDGAVQLPPALQEAGQVVIPLHVVGVKAQGLEVAGCRGRLGAGEIKKVPRFTMAST